jgi:hypothetical protein
MYKTGAAAIRALKTSKVLRTKRGNQIKAGVTNLNRLVSYVKYNIGAKARSQPKNTSRSRGAATRGAPNPSAPVYTWAPWGTRGVTHDNCYDYAFGSYSNNRTSKSVPGDRSRNPAIGLTFRTCTGIATRVLGDNPGNVYKMKTGGEKPKPGFYKVMCFVAPSNDFGNSTGDFHWYKEIRAVRYRVRTGDTITGLAKFFKVRPAVITAALGSSRAGANTNNGRIANKNSDLQVLKNFNEKVKGARLSPGKVLEIPVKLWSHKTGWAGGPLLIDASGHTITDPRKADRNYKPGFHYTKFCSAYGVRAGFAKTGNDANRNGHSASLVL